MKNVRINFILILAFVPSMFLFAQNSTGDIETYVGSILSKAPGSSGNDFEEPNASQLNTWNTLIDFLLLNNLANARSTASELNYQVTEFTDISITPNQIFYVLEEVTPATKYWGTYVFSKTPLRSNLILQAPHSKFDTNTGSQALYCFKNTGARAVFLNGTHRCNSDSFSSCSGSTSVCGSNESYRLSDMAHTVNSMFQKTTESFLNAVSGAVFVQLHGFNKQTSDPYVILSNGTRETPTTDYATLLKDALLTEDNTLTFELAHININWTRLIGFTNTQGRLINNVLNACSTSAPTTTGQFIHVEQEKSKLRDDVNDWMKMSNALSNVFSTTLSTDEYTLDRTISIIPNPTSTGAFYIKGKYIDFIDIYNSVGQRIGRQMNSANSEYIFVNTKTDIRGIYFLKIHTNSGRITKKIVLQ